MSTTTQPATRCTACSRSSASWPASSWPGVLQGYYTPIYSDIADADVTWFGAAQLVVSAMVVPPLTRLDRIASASRPA